MSEYTTELRFICETLSGYNESQDYGKIHEIIHKTVFDIFSFDFPIFDEAYKRALCEKIIKHYYTREICEETYGLWKLRLDARMNEIMPYYNELYKTALLKFNPLYEVDLTTTHTGTNTNVANSTGNSASETAGNQTSSSNDKSSSDYVDWRLHSDTPQGSLSGVSSETYLTTADKNTNTGNESRDTSGNVNNEGSTKVNYKDDKKVSNTDEYVTKVSGKTSGQSYSKLLMEFRKSILNIDKMVIDELNDLFMLIY